MAFIVKNMVGGQLKNLTGGLGEDKGEGEKSEAAAQGMTREEFEEYQRQLVEEKESSSETLSPKEGGIQSNLLAL
ncbi:hypothetical protein chiPu_0018628 [Chiloscyllium punctatum]|uniref:Complexin-3 n=1 Tax=Chiloscyllium punctatum TaxID=137246 RepID=A0A401RP44_CHIPU|nr:hypothetical protein [Chiloscyllium punctatum]